MVRLMLESTEPFSLTVSIDESEEIRIENVSISANEWILIKFSVIHD